MRSVIMSTKKPEKASSIERRRRAKGSCLEKRKAAAVDKLTTKLAKKKGKSRRMKKGLGNLMDKLKEMESECARIREEYKLAIQENVDLQLSVDYMLFAFLRGGDGES